MLDIIKQLCFFGTLAIASSIDVKRKTVPTVILLSLFLTGWINISLQSVAGFFCALIPVGITGILRQDLGGGDVKLSALCGWVMVIREYADLSAELKVLYGLLLARMGLSIKNRWYDAHKRVYIYFTLEEAAQLLGCGRDKAMRLFKELDGRLIHRRKQGCGKPSRIYVGNFAGKNSNQM